MSLDRKDARAKFDCDYHAKLALLADVDGLDMAEFIERAVCKEIDSRVHAATVIAERLARLGTSGNCRDCPGAAGNTVTGSPYGVPTTTPAAPRGSR